MVRWGNNHSVGKWEILPTSLHCQPSTTVLRLGDNLRLPAPTVWLWGVICPLIIYWSVIRVHFTGCFIDSLVPDYDIHRARGSYRISGTTTGRHQSSVWVASSCHGRHSNPSREDDPGRPNHRHNITHCLSVIEYTHSQLENITL